MNDRALDPARSRLVRSAATLLLGSFALSCGRPTRLERSSPPERAPALPARPAAQPGLAGGTAGSAASSGADLGTSGASFAGAYGGSLPVDGGSGGAGANAGDGSAGSWVREPRGGAPADVPTRFAVIGDYGTGGPDEAAVAALVSRADPDFVITTGDNNYPYGGADTIDANIGRYYQQFIAPYRGAYGPGATVNRFFPSLGNHDWGTANAAPYLDYFTLPDNERYYEIVIGNVQLFALDSDPNEPDGNGPDSAQAAWLKAKLAASTSPWRVIYFHEPPYSSGPHGGAMEMRWPFREWGASIVFSGHDHIYERLSVDGLPYVVNGVGGRSLYGLSTPDPNSLVLHTDQFGALFVSATPTRFHLRFRNTDGALVDELVLP